MNTGIAGTPGTLAAACIQALLSYLGCVCKGKYLCRCPAPGTAAGNQREAATAAQLPPSGKGAPVPSPSLSVCTVQGARYPGLVP